MSRKPKKKCASKAEFDHARELARRAVAAEISTYGYGTVKGPPHDVVMLLFDAAKVAYELGEDKELFAGKARYAHEYIEKWAEESRVDNEEEGGSK